VLAFLIAHLYLITTGSTLTSNLKAMITGYEEIKDDTDVAHGSRPQ
jgi:thiosulfate reductase cytochrome b subunit